MSENFESIEARLCAYVEGELDEQGKVEIEKHLEANPHHRRLLTELAAQRDLLRRLPREPAPAELAETFNAQLERAALLNETASPFGGGGDEPVLRISRWPQFAAVAAVLMLAGGLGLMIYFAWPRQGNSNGDYVFGTVPSTTQPSLAPAGMSHGRRDGEAAKDGSAAAGEGVRDRIESASAATDEDALVRRAAKSGEAEGRAGKALGESGDEGGVVRLRGAASNVFEEGVAEAQSPQDRAAANRVFDSAPAAPAADPVLVVVTAADPRAANGQVTEFLDRNAIQWTNAAEVPESLQPGESQALSGALRNNRQTALVESAAAAEAERVAGQAPADAVAKADGPAAAPRAGAGGERAEADLSVVQRQSEPDAGQPNDQAAEQKRLAAWAAADAERQSRGGAADNRILAYRMTRRQVEDLQAALSNQGGQRAELYARVGDYRASQQPARGDDASAADPAATGTRFFNLERQQAQQQQQQGQQAAPAVVRESDADRYGAARGTAAKQEAEARNEPATPAPAPVLPPLAQANEPAARARTTPTRQPQAPSETAPDQPGQALTREQRLEQVRVQQASRAARQPAPTGPTTRPAAGDAIRPQDELIVTIRGVSTNPGRGDASQPQMLRARVASDGTIQLPQLDAVSCEGLTPPQLERELVRRYQEVAPAGGDAAVTVRRAQSTVTQAGTAGGGPPSQRFAQGQAGARGAGGYGAAGARPAAPATGGREDAAAQYQKKADDTPAAGPGPVAAGAEPTTPARRAEELGRAAQQQQPQRPQQGQGLDSRRGGELAVPRADRPAPSAASGSSGEAARQTRDVAAAGRQTPPLPPARATATPQAEAAQQPAEADEGEPVDVLIVVQDAAPADIPVAAEAEPAQPPQPPPGRQPAPAEGRDSSPADAKQKARGDEP